MKRALLILIGALSLSAFAACGLLEDDVPDTAQTQINDRDEDDDEDDEDDSHSDPVSFEASDEEMDELLGTWRFEGVFIHTYTFYAEGTFYHAADGGFSEEGTYQFNGVDLLVKSDDTGEERYFEYKDGFLVDDEGDEYEKVADSYGNYFDEDDDWDEDDDDYEFDDPDDIVGYWEGINMPPNDWFIFTSSGEFYCYRDNDDIEWGTYEYTDSNVVVTYIPTGETDSFFLFDANYLIYDPCNGLQRISTDDSVDDWILEAVND